MPAVVAIYPVEVAHSPYPMRACDEFATCVFAFSFLHLKEDNTWQSALKS